MKKSTSFLALILGTTLFLSSSTASAQLSYGFQTMYASPQGDFAKHAAANAGFSFNSGYKIPTLPIYIGINTDFLTYGTTTNREAFTKKGYAHNDADMVRRSNMMQYTLVTRFQPKLKGLFSPYAEMRFGGNRMASTREAQDPYRDHSSSCESSEVLETKKLQSDNTLSYSYGAGVQYQMGNDSPFFIDFSVINSKGNAANYWNVTQPVFTKTEMTENGPVQTVIDDGKYYTRTDLLSVRLGFVMKFLPGQGCGCAKN